MKEERFRQNIQALHQQLRVLHSYMTQLSPRQQQKVTEVLEEITTAFGNLQLIYEEMQTSLEASAVVEDGLLQQNQQATIKRQFYYDLFQSCPDAYLVTDANGLIREANQAIARLLNVPPCYLVSKPLAVFVAAIDRQVFRTLVNQLSAVSDVQKWDLSLCPRQGEPFAALLKVVITRNESGS